MTLSRLLHITVPIVLLVAAILLVGYADRHASISDLTRNASHSLHEKSVEVLSLLPGPIGVVAYVPENPELRAWLGNFFARYQRHKPDLGLEFVDPRLIVDAAQARSVNLGEINIEYAGQDERLTRLNESEVSTALARLARGTDRWITFLAHNGERRIAREANDDLTEFARHLERRGLNLREFTLGQMTTIPDNTAVLVLASPSVAYLPTEAEEITRFVAAGGHVLWLTEPDAAAALGSLEQILGIGPTLGTIVDPVGLAKFRNAAYAVALERPEHPILAGFNQTVVFPYAAALTTRADTGWTVTSLARTHAEAWTETGTFDANVGFDAPDEIQGQLNLAFALSRPSPESGTEQRAVVIGDGDFLSNRFVENVGNLEFGRRSLEWLAADDALIDIAVPAILDTDLSLEMWQRLTIFLFFGVGLPVVLALNGGLLWWRRRA